MERRVSVKTSTRDILSGIEADSELDPDIRGVLIRRKRNALARKLRTSRNVKACIHMVRKLN